MKNRFQFNEDVWGYFVNAIVCYFIVVLTLGLGTPWAVCRMQRWVAKNTSLNGKKMDFVGEGSDLFGKFIIWFFLTLITFGIYGLWMAVKMQKFISENTVIEE